MTLETDFQDACQRAVNACRDLGYNPTAWVGMIERYGAVDAAKKLLVSGDLQPGLLRLLKLGRTDLTIEHAVLAKDLGANDQRQDYLRARLDVRDDGVTQATPVSHQDSSLLANLSVAQGLVIRPPFAPAAPAGSPCSFIRLPN